MKVRLGALLILGLLVAAPLCWAPEGEVARPISENEFMQLVQAKVPAEDLIAQVRARGISFKLTTELEETLKTLKVKKEVLEALVAPATLELHVNVGGAEVLVDQEKRQPASAQGQAVFTGLAPGSHLVRVQAEGYVADSLEVFLKPGEMRRMQMELHEAVVITPGPLGSRVNVQAGTPEDTALAELEFAKEPATRVPLLQKFVEHYANSPVALLGYGMLQETYLEDKQFDNSLAAGEEVLRRDPRNFPAHLRQVHAALGKGDLEKAFDYAARAHQLVEELRAATPPAGTSAESWEQEKRRLLESAESDWGNLAYTVFVALNDVSDPARKAALLERFLDLFPQPEYRPQALVALALAYQQQGNAEKMMAWASKALEADPNQPTMLVLVAEVLSERGQKADLDRARALATRLLNLLTNEADKVRPAGLSEEQWDPLRQSWEGIAHTVLGQVLMYEEKTQEAIQEFRAAGPLLKGQTQLYARNLYRLGFAYAKLGELRPARDALTEAVALDTPYRQPARELLGKVQQKLGGR